MVGRSARVRRFVLDIRRLLQCFWMPAGSKHVDVNTCRWLLQLIISIDVLNLDFIYYHIL